MNKLLSHLGFISLILRILIRKRITVLRRESESTGNAVRPSVRPSLYPFGCPLREREREGERERDRQTDRERKREREIDTNRKDILHSICFYLK